MPWRLSDCLWKGEHKDSEVCNNPKTEEILLEMRFCSTFTSVPFPGAFAFKSPQAQDMGPC